MSILPDTRMVAITALAWRFRGGGDLNDEIEGTEEDCKNRFL